MGARDVAHDDKAKARAAHPGQAGERLEQPLAGARAQAGAVVGDVDHQLGAAHLGRDSDEVRAGLEGVAHQVAECTLKLVAVGGDLQGARHLVVDPPARRPRVRGDSEFVTLRRFGFR